MANKAKFQAIKGTRDLLPPETELWNRVEETAREVFGTFGFGEIRPPVFEPTELFARAVGGETDIVSKEMYSFEDARGDLQEMREVIRNYALPATDEHWTNAFLGLLRNFQTRLEAGIRSGEVEHDKEAHAFYDYLSEGITHFQTELSHGVGTNKPEIERTSRLLKLAVAGAPLGPSVCLRPEATASVCRAYIEHGMQQWPAPAKLYYMGPMFRRERPQKGRYRQFYQIGAEVLGGTDAPGIDAEVIEMVMAFFGRLELQGVQLEINSIGHSAPNCRRGYVEKLKAALVEVKDKLGADSQRRIETNPLRVLDSKLEHEQAIIEKLPRIADSLCDECKSYYANVKRQLDLRGVAYRENWRLVRGLDYYVRTTFEITAQGLGSQNAVCGGGRYDGLVELLGGPPTKGIGFAIGEDRLILSLQEAGKGGTATGRDVYIAWMGEKAQATAIVAARKLRAAGLRVELPPVEQKFGKALGQADKLGAKFALILGEDEVASGEWTVKRLADGTQEKVSGEAVEEFLKRKK
jgi:histidyl-tRNA synthetase